MRTPHLARRRPAGGSRRGSAVAGTNFATAACIAALAVAGFGCKVVTDSAPSGNTTQPAPEPEPDEEPVVRDHRGRGAGADDDAGDEAAGDPTDSTGGTGAGDDGERQLLVPEDHDQYARVEGTSFPNDCERDADCHVGGCSSEICSAEEGVNSTCIMPAEGWVSQGGSCGCVEGTCAWYGGDGESGGGRAPAGKTEIESGGSAQALEGQGEACRDGKCAGELTCIKYYGVAGRQGPQFSSCEIPCPRGGDQCPDGQTCVTIADGPGQVCRARN